MSNEIEQRVARNEAIFREVNEGIRRGQWPGEEASMSSFRCECASLGCTVMLPLSVREYERVRQNDRRFIVAPGHERSDVEVVVDTRAAYLVVQKIGEAGQRAAKADPRS
jgi:hypothetical protein